MIIWNCDVCGESQAVCHGDNRPGRCWTRKIDSSYSEPDAVFCGEACRAKWQLMEDMKPPVAKKTRTKRVRLPTAEKERMCKRIQLRRTKGWRKPAGGIVVSRPSRFGNPYAVRTVDGQWGVFLSPPPLPWKPSDPWPVRKALDVWPTKRLAVESSVRWYRKYLAMYPELANELRGHDLGCWCAASQPCHASVLLELANR